MKGRGYAFMHKQLSMVIEKPYLGYTYLKT